MQFLKEDKLEGKSVSHLRLKSEVINNEKYLIQKSFTKKDLLLLCKAYQISVSAQKNNNYINSHLVQKILISDCIPSSNVLENIVPSVSTSGISFQVSESNVDTVAEESAIAEASTQPVSSESSVPSTSVENVEIPGTSSDTTLSSPTPNVIGLF